MSDKHPLQAVSALAQAQGVLPHKLIVDHEGKLVRLRTTSGLWVLRGSENGSMYDRWSDAEGKTFVKLTEAQIAEGPQAILDLLLAASQAQP